jgi:hypothetical protein
VAEQESNRRRPEKLEPMQLVATAKRRWTGECGKEALGPTGHEFQLQQCTGNPPWGLEQRLAVSQTKKLDQMLCASR